jgi:P-aminobenzoate N-oxygenase AurF
LFESWDERAAVRSKPRRVLLGDAEGLYPESLMPILTHPLLTALESTQRRALQARHLVRYLRFTQSLETLVVNDVVCSIMNRDVDFDLGERMHLDAARIYCDEAYHALFCADMMLEVQRRERLPMIPRSKPHFLHRFAQTLETLGSAGQRNLAKLVFVIVSEMLITGNLSEVVRAGAADVDSGVTELMADHAGDEARHHAYFRNLLLGLWPYLNREQRELVGRLIPEFIDTFVSVDHSGIVTDLRSIGLALDHAEQIVTETYTPAIVARSRRTASRALLACVSELEMLRSPGVSAAFAAYALTPTAALAEA